MQATQWAADAQHICAGDYNSILDVAIDTSKSNDIAPLGGSGIDGDARQEKHNWMQHMAVVDTFRLLHPTDKSYTHLGTAEMGPDSQITTTASRRLDRILFDEAIHGHVHDITHTGVEISDHTVVEATIRFPPLRHLSLHKRIKPWHLTSDWTQSISCVPTLPRLSHSLTHSPTHRSGHEKLSAQ